MTMSGQETTNAEPAVMLMLPSSSSATSRRSSSAIARLRCASEWLVPGVLVSVLLPIIHLLLELLRLLLVREREPCHAILKLEGVEEGAVLVVRKGVVDLLVPDHAAAGWLYSVSRLVCT